MPVKERRIAVMGYRSVGECQALYALLIRKVFEIKYLQLSETFVPISK